MKDNFSSQADLYAKYRPTYPENLIVELLSNCNSTQLAWDCACGNGQISSLLSPHFQKVFASDISQKQIDNAVKKSNITYEVEHAENSSLINGSVDLIVVAQAIHWFHFDDFYKEVKRVLKPKGVIAVLGYGLFTSTPEIDIIIHSFYEDIIGKYWDAERKYLDEKYQTIPFPFNEKQLSKHFITMHWTPEDIIGYINTWSAVPHYIKQHGFNPTTFIEDDLKNAFGNKHTVEIITEIYTRVGTL